MEDLTLDARVASQITDDVIDQVHDHLYGKVGGDPDALYDEVAEALQFGIHSELTSLRIPLPIRSEDEEGEDE